MKSADSPPNAAAMRAEPHQHASGKLTALDSIQLFADPQQPCLPTFSATDLSNFLGCTHLALLDRAARTVGRSRDAWLDSHPLRPVCSREHRERRRPDR